MALWSIYPYPFEQLNWRIFLVIQIQHMKSLSSVVWLPVLKRFNRWAKSASFFASWFQSAGTLWNVQPIIYFKYPFVHHWLQLIQITNSNNGYTTKWLWAMHNFLQYQIDVIKHIFTNHGYFIYKNDFQITKSVVQIIELMITQCCIF